MKVQGVFSTEQLREQGVTMNQLARALENGSTRRIAKGWYIKGLADPRVVTAIESNCRLGCLSGCEFHGIWTPKSIGLHIVHGTGSRPRTKGDYHVHWSPKPQPRTAVWPLEDCLEQVVRHHDIETSLIVLESAIDEKMISIYTAWEILDNCRGSVKATKLHRIRKYLSAAESGSETRVRLFLQQLQIPVVPQVEISGVGRVDLVIGDRLVIECDSHKHHSKPEDQLRDRKRDLALRDLGYEVIRLAYQQIWGADWEDTKPQILNETRRRRHILRR